VILQVATLSYTIGAFASVLALAIILISRARHSSKYLLLAACGVTAVWAATIAGTTLFGFASQSLALMVLEQLRSAAWIAVAVVALSALYGRKLDWRVGVKYAAIPLAAMVYSIAITVLDLFGIAPPALAIRGVHLAHVLVAVVALLLIENLFRNSGREARWAVKYLCFGLGVMFSYDFFVYAEAALLGHLDADIYAARGIIQAIAMPLVILSAVRSKTRPIDVHISRDFVFHSATLLAAGAYLIVMAAAGYSLRAFDSPWGIISQVSFLMAALLVLAITLSSGQVQAHLRNFISRNFFSYKYDYRVEWLRFIDAISDSATNLPIPQRAGQALANIIGSTGGVVWIRGDEESVLHAAASWNMGDLPADIAISETWLTELARHAGVINVRRGDLDGDKPIGARLPAWLVSCPRAFIILPLHHAQKFIGFVLLADMRAPRSFGWEDFDLLKTASRQAASYIAEETAAQALARARRFEEFNRRFAFIVHDVKNLAAQMTLILKNAEHHGGKPEFQKDMLHTVGESASRLRAMLEQLRTPLFTAAVASPLDLVALLHDLGTTWKLQFPRLEANLPDEPVSIVGHDGQLRAVLNHLIQNAADAAGQDGSVALELHIEGVHRSNATHESAEDKCWAVITVVDDGPGMEADFIENKLFQPLTSEKINGFGIGAFQARQIARDMGGRLEIESKRGRGSRIMVRLPYVPPAGSDETGLDRYEPASQVLKSA